MRWVRVFLVFVVVSLVPAVSFSGIRVVPKSTQYKDHLDMRWREVIESKSEKKPGAVVKPASIQVRQSARLDAKDATRPTAKSKKGWVIPEPVLRFIDFFVWDIR